MSQLILPRGYLDNVATLGEINPDDEVINSFFRIIVPAFSAYGALPTDILGRSITQTNPDAYRWPGGIGKRGFYFGGGGTAGVATIPVAITATTSFALLSIVGKTPNAVIIGADRYEFGISSGSVYGATRLVGDSARVTHVSASVAPGDAVLFVRKNGVGEYLWVNGALVSSYTTTLALITNSSAQIIDSRSANYLLGSYVGEIGDTLAERVTSPFYKGFLQKSSRRILYFDVGGGATAVDSDLSDSYVLRAALSSDLADSYAIRSAIAADLADSYAVLSSVAADLADSYAITASVNADLADSYLIRASVAQDLADSYAVRASIASDLADSYTIEVAGTVSSDLADSYLIRAAIASDLSDSAAIRAAVLADIADEYTVRSSVSQDLADQYTVINAVQADLDDSYIIRAAVAQDLIDSYTVFSGSGTGATAEEIWAVVMDGSLTASEMMRIMFAALAGKREGIGTATERYYGQDGVTPRITLTPDPYGNGTPVVDGS